MGAKQTIKRAARSALARAGYVVTRLDHQPPASAATADFDDEMVAIIDRVRSETMTSPERIAAVVEAVRYVDRCGITGAIVECGVWRGGSSMAAALAHHPRQRPLWLYDTFEGMPPPTADDVDLGGTTASWALATEPRTTNVWAVADLEVVQRNLAATGYPPDLIRYVEGKVEDTVPAQLPDEIAVLRLDTDWYESTRHELAHLAPRIAPHGVLIIDDYGHWQGARKAVDEWIAASSRPVMLCRTDYTGRIAVLP